MHPIPPSSSRKDACRVAESEYTALLAMLSGLADENWHAPTECAPWTVSDLVAHIAGAAEEAVRLRVQLRHLRGARRRIGGATLIDALNEQQLSDREGATAAELLAELRDLADRAPRARRRTPWFVRRQPLPSEAGGPAGESMAYLLDVIYPRDVWMHRIDIARATGCELPESGVESEVVAQVVRDLDRAWTGIPFALTLTGRVEGTWPIGGPVHDAGPRVEVDAIAACRTWSGRSDETRLPTDDPVSAQLTGLRLLF